MAPFALHSQVKSSIFLKRKLFLCHNTNLLHERSDCLKPTDKIDIACSIATITRTFSSSSSISPSKTFATSLCTALKVRRKLPDPRTGFGASVELGEKLMISGKGECLKIDPFAGSDCILSIFLGGQVALLQPGEFENLPRGSVVHEQNQDHSRHLQGDQFLQSSQGVQAETDDKVFEFTQGACSYQWSFQRNIIRNYVYNYL